MAELTRLNCLGCGAPIKVHERDYYIECSYCGNTFGLPEDLRPRRSGPSFAEVMNINSMGVHSSTLSSMYTYPSNRYGY